MKTDAAWAEASRAPVRLCGQEAEEYEEQNEGVITWRLFFFFFFSLQNKRLDVGRNGGRHSFLIIPPPPFFTSFFISPRGFFWQVIDHSCFISHLPWSFVLTNICPHCRQWRIRKKQNKSFSNARYEWGIKLILWLETIHSLLGFDWWWSSARMYTAWTRFPYCKRICWCVAMQLECRLFRFYDENDELRWKNSLIAMHFGARHQVEIFFFFFFFGWRKSKGKLKDFGELYTSR